VLLENSSWKMVADYLERDDRLVIVAGATEEHGPNSLGTDTQCAWEIAKIACERTGVMLAPALPFGPSIFSMDFPGTMSIRLRTFLDLIQDLLESVTRSGFKRILILSGHGGNKPAMDLISEFVLDRSDLTIKFREWYYLPRTYDRVHQLGSTAWDHGSWLESFSWINQPGEIPDIEKTRVLPDDYYALSAEESRLILGDGVGGGKYKQSEEIMRDFFNLAVDEVTEFLDNGWSKTSTDMPE
jgi:creatinine amidohydrolase